MKRTLNVNVSILAIFIVLITAVSTSPAQTKVFLNQGTMGTPDTNPTNITEVTADVGETIAIDVWFDVGTTADVSGISVYISFDSTQFRVLDQLPGSDEIQPFKTSEYSSLNFWTGNETDGAGQLVGHADLTNGSITESGRFSRFEVETLKAASGAEVSIDFDVVNHRNTRMTLGGGGEVTFDSLEGLTVDIGVTSIDDIIATPDRFTLHQNYPNPFNPETNIAFDLVKASQIKLAVYDLTGREVATISEDFLPAGSHAFTWNGLNRSGIRVASGVYIYRLMSGNLVTSRKMILLK